MIDYRIVIQDKSGLATAELQHATDVEYGFYLNKPGDASFSLPLHGSGINPGDISLGFTELFIYRGETLVWAGEIQTRRSSRSGGKAIFGAKGWLALLDRREFGNKDYPMSFVQADPSEIIEFMLFVTQSQTHGDLGLTMGSKAISRPRDRNYQYANMKDAIEGLTAARIIDGIDIEITPDKVFNTYYPKGQILGNVHFEIGRNIIDWEETEDGTALANQVIILGAGDGISMLTATSNSPDYLQESYRLRQQSLAFKDVSIQSTLDDHAEAERVKRQIPSQIVSITTDTSLSPGWGAYSVGDTVRATINEGSTQIDGWYRIYGIHLKRSDLGKELVKLTFNPS